MATNKPLESTELHNDEMDGVIDFGMLRLGGGAVVQPVTEREFKMATADGTLAYEKFMQEPVVVVIHKTTDKNEPTVVYLGSNGMSVWVPRDRKVRLPRTLVECLARSQIRFYEQVRNPDPNADEGMETKRHGGGSYPFAVLHDPNPRGAQWLRRVMHESA